MERIVDLQMKEIAAQLAETGLKVSLTDTARQWLAKEGYDPSFGARPLRRALQKHVESPLSVRMLKGDFKSGDTVQVDHTEAEGIVFQRLEAQPVQKVEPAPVP